MQKMNCMQGMDAYLTERICEDCSWYEGVYTADEWDSYGDSYFFNDVEMANRNLLVKTEKKRR